MSFLVIQGNDESYRVEAYLSARSLISSIVEAVTVDETGQRPFDDGVDLAEGSAAARNPAPTAHSSPYLVFKRMSPWSRSGAKRLFDCVCVLLALPLLVPVLLAIALAVWLTSSGPVLFLQKRVGHHGRTFTILKFRTLVQTADKAHHAVTTAGNQRFTPAGPFLRRWKLDELPQLLNVLAGHMSMVGPRPKMREHVLYDPLCRPGITGAATIAFAREEAVLDRVPKHQLESYYHAVVLPAKRQLDAEYMAHATFFSDFKLIVNSVLRRWDTSVMEKLLNTEDRMLLTKASHPEAVSSRMPVPPNVDQPASAEQATAF
jgi:lipopolysaccharide/colanic/teichoic acid biosynthesis glycosyltransferase